MHLTIDCHLKFIGSISYRYGSFERFDQEMAKIAHSEIHEEFFKIIKYITEEDVGFHLSPNVNINGYEQDVLSNI